MSGNGYSDSIDGNIDLLSQLLSGATRDFGKRAHHAAGLVERAVLGIIDSGKGDPAVALGVTCAVHKIAKLMVEGDAKAAETGQGVIQLLS